MRLIDADVLMESFGKLTVELWLDSVEEAEIASLIGNAPTIDTVNIDRCKCDFGKCHEQGDTLYESSDWDGGIGFDYIRDIKYCPLCGGLLDG